MAHTASTEQRQCCDILGKGSKVEVWSEEDCFRNAWFSAEILKPPPSARGRSGRKRKKAATAMVRYDHMLSPNGDGSPLVEKVETRFIRPAPPPDDPPYRPFELNEVVDAFFQDTWWTGFVVRDVNDTYTVAFKSPLDLQEFRRSDMRLHWDWVDSKWVRPDKEDTTGMIYIPGIEVEVNRHDESPCHAWLQGVVIGQVGSTSFLVKYKCSDTGDESLKQETVELEQIRPHPPEMEVENFDVSEKVNVFCNSCWWVGVITKILEGKKYIVTLRHKKVMEFNHSELRPHLEWIDGQWVTKSKGVPLTSDCQKQIRQILDQSSGAMDDTDKETPCLGDKQDNKQVLSPCVDESPYLEGSNLENENHISTADKPVEVTQNGDDKITKQQEVGEMENQAVIPAKKRGGQRKSHESSGSILDDTEEESPCLGNKQGNQKESSPHVEKPPYLGSSNLEKENHISSSEPAEAIPNEDDKITEQQEVGETEKQAVTSAKKRGRPWKCHESSGHILADIENEKSCSGNKQGNQKKLCPHVEKLPYLGSSNMEKENHICSGDKPAEVIPNGHDKKTRLEEAGEMENQAVVSATKRGRPRKSHESSGSTLDETEKERPCSSEKVDNQEESTHVVKLPCFGNLNMEKENHISSGGKPVEVIRNGDDKKTKQQESGETENPVVISAKKRGRQQKSCDRSGSTLDDTENKRPSHDKEDNQKKLSPRVDKLTSVGSSSVEKENDFSSGDKPVEVIHNGDDKKTKQQEAGETENQTVISSKKRGRSQESEPNNSWAVKHRRGGPSGPKIKESQPSSIVEGSFIKAADTKHLEAMMEELEVCCDMSKDFEGVRSPHVENSCQPPTVNEQKGAPETSSEVKGNGEQPELVPTNTQAAVAGEELCECGGVAADCTTEKSKSSVTTEVLLTGTLEKDGTTLGSPMPIIVSSNDQALSMPVVETHAPTNVGESGINVRRDVQNLPFEKSYPIWQIIESMEVFKKLPQNPHFQPLMNCKEIKREGSAIGHMMNFASLVERIFKLQENDSREDFESILEELDELKEFGFDVEVVRGRVSELLQAKFMLENFMDKSKGVEIEIRECTDAKTKIDGVVADIDKELKRLEEKRAVLMSESEEKGSKLAKLNSEARVINEGISSTRKSFRSLVETPW